MNHSCLTVETLICVFWPGVLQSTGTEEGMNHSLSLYGFIPNVENPVAQTMILLHSQFRAGDIAHGGLT